MDNSNINKAKNLLLKTATISVAAIAVFNLYVFYRNNIWKPEVKVIDVDFEKGVANLLIDGRKFILRGDSAYLISFDWSIKFGTIYTGEKRSGYDRIELLKRNSVKKIITQR